MFSVLRLLCAAFALASVAAAASPHVVFVTGDDEYRSEYSMPAIARILETHHGFRTSIAYSRPTPQTPDNIEGLEALRTADLAVFYLRWRQLPDSQMRLILNYLESGKPLAGLRTTTHSFRYPAGHEFERWNDGFGIEVFGQKWFRHHGHLSTTAVSAVAARKAHPILRGVEPGFTARSWLYEVEPLAGDSQPLLEGRAINPQGKDTSPQPVAWTKTYRGARVFFTTLGHPEDFQLLSARRLLINGILWALGAEIPTDGAAADFVGAYEPPASGIPRPATKKSADAAKGGERENRRTELNLLAKTDTANGESRRNENIQFNLIDNNALKELNQRMGITATIASEFRADRGYYGVEYGNRPTAPIHLGSSSNSGFHGSLFWGHDNSVFAARSFFQVGGVRPAVENQYGAELTMRPWRGAALSLDASQQFTRGNVNGNVLVPLAGERTPRTNHQAIRPVLLRFLNAYPAELPNRTDINERALNTNAPQAIDDSNLTGRLDQSVGSSNVVSLRYQFTTQQVDAFQLVAGQNPDTTTRAHAAAVTWSRQFSPATVGNFSAGFDRVTSLLVPEPNAVGQAVSFAGVIERLGPSSSIPIDRRQNRFRYSAGFAQTRGRHNLHAGWEVARRHVNGSEVSSHRGTLTFRNDFGRDTMTNFLTGQPSRFSGAIGHIHRGFRVWEWKLYLGDSFRATPNLTLIYGVRYEPFTRAVEVNQLNTLPYSCDCNNLAPRFGFAYRLPSGWGTLRAAYGLHYGELFAVTFQQIRYNPPHNRKFEIVAPDLLASMGALNIPLDPNARSTQFELSPGLKAPYSHQYNFTWEPSFSSNWRLQLGYVGSRSHGLLMMWYTNRAQPVPGVPQLTSTINDRRPDSTRFDVRRILNGSRGYFDAGRVSLILPRWRGLSIDASYWLSKAIDLGAAYSNTATGEDGRQTQSQSEFHVWKEMKGPSNFDQSHAFLWRAAYTTPAPASRGWLARLAGKWDLSAITLVKTGTPFSVISGSDAPGFGNVDGDNGDRPHLLNPSILGRTIGNPDTSLAMLPVSAFAFVLPTELRGSLGSNTFRRAGIGNVNASISRSFPIGGDRKLLFRAQSVNFFNTPQFAEPTRELTSPSFGFINNTLNDGRNFRFLLRLSF
ncbi:MAG: hypothetical protein FJW20_11345 [Acidimicrobiia bacterium]|nr:hypothetical protein [Acidimicrobiia bacterium]